MIALSLLCLVGMAAGFLLVIRVPACNAQAVESMLPCSIVIPARNEAHNLPRLLRSLGTAGSNVEIVVVDDHSTDDTGNVAAQYAARVITAPPLQHGWTGKTSACFAGASAAAHDVLLFLDADTHFERSGLDRLLQAFAATEPDRTALSVVPFHRTRKLYEDFSLFFNLLMVFGAGGFGLLGDGRLFGQSLVINRSLYHRSGTHAVVSAEILENLALAPHVEAAGGRCVCLGGRGVLSMRMFPDGFGQLCDGWTKAFASGAAASGKAVLVAAVLWLSALSCGFLWLLFASGSAREIAAIFYLGLAIQIAWFARQIGSFRWFTCLLYPVPLLFFFVIFARSLRRRASRQPVTWRGRQV